MKPGPVVLDTAPPACVDYAAWLGPAQRPRSTAAISTLMVLGLCQA